MSSLDLPTPTLFHPVRRLLLAATVVLLHGCAGVPAQTTAVPVPTPQRIPVCSGYGCRIADTVALSDVEWRSVRAMFIPRAENPADERRRIARAIAQLEKIIGPKTETEHDKGGTFPGLFQAGQMDCVDESTNTTVYLRLLAANNLLRWHEAGPDTMRGYFLFGWPHTTATIRETGSGEDYAVDSWFFDNGVEPVIIPLKLWRAGWRPAAAKP